MRRRTLWVTLPLVLELKLGFFLNVKSFESQPLADWVSDHQQQHHTDHIPDRMLVGQGERNSVADGVITCHIRLSNSLKVMAK